MAAENGFQIDGVIYEHPFATWDLDDAELLYNKTGLVLEDWVLATEEDRETLAKFRDPKVLRTLAAISYWKQHKTEAFDDIYRDVVGGITVASLYETLFGADDVPPAQTTEPEKLSGNGSVSSSESSGDDSTMSSARPDSLLAPTGTTG